MLISFDLGLENVKKSQWVAGNAPSEGLWLHYASISESSCCTHWERYLLGPIISAITLWRPVKEGLKYCCYWATDIMVSECIRNHRPLQMDINALYYIIHQP